MRGKTAKRLRREARNSIEVSVYDVNETMREENWKPLYKILKREWKNRNKHK